MTFVVRSLLVVVVLACTPFTVVAEPGAAPRSRVFMSEADMTASFSGKTIDGHYADGVTFTEAYTAEGRIDYRERGRDMTGRWLVRDGTFCTLYDTSPTGGCYRVTRKGTNCFEFYFVARDDKQVDSGPGQPPAWTAQAWVQGPPPTCKEDPTV